MATSEGGELDKRVGGGGRLFPLTIDLLCVGFITALMFGILPSSADYLALFVVPAAVFALYFLGEGIAGASPGKWLAGLQVGTAECQRAGRGRLLRRYALKNLCPLVYLLGVLLDLADPGTTGLFVVVWSVAFAAGVAVFFGFVLAFDEQKQAWHDRASDTAVFRKADLSSALHGENAPLGRAG